MPDSVAADVLRVAVGVVQRSDGQVLVAERHERRHQGGRLEFPGGKCDPGESARDALRRELREEIGIEVTASEPLIRVRHDYHDRRVELETFLVTAWRGEPGGAEGQAIHWADPAQLTADRFPAANRPILATLNRPALCLITPDIDAVSAADELLSGLDQAMATWSVGLVQIRRRDRGSSAWRDLVFAAAERCTARGIRLMVNGTPELLEGLPEEVGLHLPAAVHRSISSRPVAVDRLLSCACHDATEIANAERIEADQALIGPVLPTGTHPGAPTLGWNGLARLAARTTLPVYALGGLEVSDLVRARDAGAIGVAGIRGFWPGTETV
ncbi:Nudix family hydrolase [Halofilum ochraceum]|uniref:Nudix family hydrolase n=1 Tax=Halofilum ochraceum TaxID=1611323 RepID=UPI0008D9D086|nr:Nudix family hydrolase [Halofilum ochraceum]